MVMIKTGPDTSFGPVGILIFFIFFDTNVFTLYIACNIQDTQRRERADV